MNCITIKLNELNKELNFSELIFLKCIYENNDIFLKKICEIYKEDTLQLIYNLEKKLYIKLIKDDITSLDSYDIRQKGIDIFNTLSQNNDTISNVIKYLNSKMKEVRGFNVNAKSNRKFISARLSEGFTEQDLKDVIDVKTEEWLGTSQEFYLRPSTLFNSEKFQSYINQVDRWKKNSHTTRRM